MSHFCTKCDEPLFMHPDLWGEFSPGAFDNFIEPAGRGIPPDGSYILLSSAFEENRHQWNSLHWATFFGMTEMIELLLASGIDVKTVNRLGETALHLARTCSIARLLIEKGASINARSVKGETPLFEALRYGQRDMVELLIKRGADVNARNARGSTPLHRAARMGSGELAELLLRYRAEVNMRDCEGRTPLHLVESREMAALLIAYRAEVNARDMNGWTPLGATLIRERVSSGSQGLSEVISLLIARGAEK
ncbi:MAG: ankyrin repeat domain-containing protein [Candidatus Eremiobacteraeota bacterium]|nr:ankyrin repeat domain-containing protein [Candidatus Eremiobacteraeota bacterium]